MTGHVLLIGASSPLGRATTAALSAEGVDVIATSRSGHGIRLDVRSRADVDALLARIRPSKVAYLASPKPEELSDDVLAEEMLAAFAHLAERCARTDVESFVFASTGAVYGTAGSTPWREDGPTEGRSPYARFKLRSEQILRDAGRGVMTTTSLRYFNLYGPGFRNSLINRLASTSERPTLQLGDTFVRDYVRADAAGAAMAIALRRPRGSADRVFNVGTGSATSNARLMELVSPMPTSPPRRGLIHLASRTLPAPGRN